jgi:hypothetical protein
MHPTSPADVRAVVFELIARRRAEPLLRVPARAEPADAMREALRTPDYAQLCRVPATRPWEVEGA